MTAFELLCRIIASEVMGEDTLAGLEKELDESTAAELYGVAKTFDMTHLCGSALKKIKPSVSENVLTPFYNEFAVSVFRNRRLTDELRQISELFENEGIDHIALKGSVIRAYYPEPWMRTSCDIDVLVHEEDLDRAVALFEQKGYKSEPKKSHDVSLYSVGGIHIELHYETVEEEYAANANTILSNIWDHTVPQSIGSAHMLLTDEMFYFYHIAHMAKHLENGGCGIRPFLDLWVLEHRIEHSDTRRNTLLEQGGLLRFANAARRLSDVWFSDAKHDEVTEQLQSYILFGGVYGTLENRVAAQQNKQGGKIRYIMTRIFMPYDSLKFLYPVLNQHKWLTPVMEVRRWFRLLRKGRMKQSLHELNVNKTMSQEQVAGTADLLQKLGLD